MTRTIIAVPHASDVAWVSNPDDPRYQRAMKHTCEICDAKPGRPCWNTIDTPTHYPAG